MYFSWRRGMQDSDECMGRARGVLIVLAVFIASMALAAWHSTAQPRRSGYFRRHHRPEATTQEHRTEPMPRGYLDRG